VTELRSIAVTFLPEGGLEVAVSYAHGDELPSPVHPAKTRTARASRMARKVLEVALEGLGTGAVEWGGHGTNTKESTDRILVAGGGGGR
jgi:hypothetical protein